MCAQLCVYLFFCIGNTINIRNNYINSIVLYIFCIVKLTIELLHGFHLNSLSLFLQINLK